MDRAIGFSINKVKKGMTIFTDCFPEEQSKDYVYQPIKDKYSWTEGFWTGMLWLAYEFTGEECFKELAGSQILLFEKRLINKEYIDHHDMGFLFSLSCVAAYKITGNKKARDTAVLAADTLLGRFREKGEFIQAWGEIDVPDNYRLIIDCLLNIPLLFWATEETGDKKYEVVARKHLKTAIATVIRDDFTTYHTYYFDTETGKPSHGVTHQGYSNDSCWARGQAWGVYGLALAYAYTEDESLIPLFNGVTECFLSKLPEDNVPYWDMIFTSGDEPRDTSAAAIAACGILEMNKYVKNDKFMLKCEEMLKSLEENYFTENFSNGILTDGMYSKPHGDKPECNIWGDYFYMEALMRMKKPDWKMYW